MWRIECIQKGDFPLHLISWSTLTQACYGGTLHCIQFAHDDIRAYRRKKTEREKLTRKLLILATSQPGREKKTPEMWIDARVCYLLIQLKNKRAFDRANDRCSDRCVPAVEGFALHLKHGGGTGVRHFCSRAIPKGSLHMTGCVWYWYAGGEYSPGALPTLAFRRGRGSWIGGVRYLM